MLADLLQMVSAESPRLPPWVALGAAWGWTYLTVAARLGGLFAIGPLFGHRSVSVVLRLGLVLCLALVVTPMLAVRTPPMLPAGGWEAVCLLASESLIGALLGLGVAFVFAGLKLAGELIDLQTGAAIQDVVDPMSGETLGPGGRLLTILGTLALLSTAPADGHLMIVSALLDSFLTVPPAALWPGTKAITLLSTLGQASLTLGLQAAAPVLATATIVSWGVAVLSTGSDSRPEMAASFGVPLRIVVSLAMVAVCLSGITDAFLTTFADVLHAIGVA